MTILEFLKNEIIEVIDEYIEDLESFEDFATCVNQYIEAQHYSIYEEDAIELFKKFFKFFFGKLIYSLDFGPLPSRPYCVESSTCSILQELAGEILDNKNEGIAHTLQSSKLSTEGKKMQLIALLSTSIKEIEEDDPFERFED